MGECNGFHSNGILRGTELRASPADRNCPGDIPCPFDFAVIAENINGNGKSAAVSTALEAFEPGEHGAFAESAFERDIGILGWTKKFMGGVVASAFIKVLDIKLSAETGHFLEVGAFTKSIQADSETKRI